MKQMHCSEQGFNQFIFQHCLPQVSKSINKSLTKVYFHCFCFLFRNNYRHTGSCKNSTESQVPFTQLPPVVTSYMAVVQYENLEVGIGALLLLDHRSYSKSYF